MKKFILLRMRCTTFFSTSIIAEHIKGDIDSGFTVSKPVRVFEILNNNGTVGVNYVADHLWSEGVEVYIPGKSVEYSREITDTDADNEALRQMDSALLALSAPNLHLPKPAPISSFRRNPNQQ